MSSPGSETATRFRKIQEFLSSDIFIIVVVVLVIVLLTISVICCIHRRRQNQRLLTERLTRIVVVRAASANENGQPTYTLRIETDQAHATRLVGLITGHPHRTHTEPALHRHRLSPSTLEGPGCGRLPRPRVACWRNILDQKDLDEYLSPGHASLPVLLPGDSASPDLPSSTIPTFLKASQSAPDILLTFSQSELAVKLLQ